jgi:hypothetical protein
MAQFTAFATRVKHQVLQQWTEHYPPHGTVNRIVDIIRDRLDIIIIIIEMIDGIVVIIHTGAAAAEGAAITTIDGAEEARDNREILAIDSVVPPQPL